MNKSTRLIIARHGNTFGPGDIVRRVGITDLSLVESGLNQGRALGNYLKQNNLLPDVIFTSTLKRTIQTAEQSQEAMRTHLPIEKLTIFDEINYGPDENQPETEVISRIGTTALQEWEQQAKVPNGWLVNPTETIKNWENFSNRLRQDYSEKTILVITSNGIARFSPYLTGDFNSFSKQHGIKISTGAVCLFENIAPSKLWACKEWNVKPIY